VPPLKWPGSARFIMPLIGVCAAAGAFASRRTAATRTALFMLVYLGVVFAAFDWALSGGLFQIQYYVSWFLPLAFFGVAAALAPMGLSMVGAVGISGCIVALQASAVAGVPKTLHSALIDRAGVGSIVAEITLAGAALMAIAIVSWRGRRTTHAVILALCMVVADFVAAPNLDFGPSVHGRSQFQAVQQTMAFIRAYVPPRSQPLFWIAAGKNASYFASLASTHLYLYSLMGHDYPRLPDDARKYPRAGATLEPGDYVIITADTEADPASVERELRRFGLHGRFIVSEPVRTDDTSFVLTLLRVAG
jgi:hypothetical protein